MRLSQTVSDPPVDSKVNASGVSHIPVTDDSGFGLGLSSVSLFEQLQIIIAVSTNKNNFFIVRLFKLNKCFKSYRINSCCGGLYAKRKCGVVRLST